MSAEPDYLPADALAEEEPKYLRRQKPVEIRKRKFSRKTWPLYRRVLAGTIAALAVGVAAYQAGHYFLFSPSVMLENPGQIQIEGNRFVSRDAIVEKFSADLGRSVVRVPLEDRRKAIESLPWVEQAGVQRVLPNQIRVEITERAPVAFLRTAGDLSLVDSHGMILERPADGEFRFPVVSGIGESMPRELREQRMNSYVRVHEGYRTRAARSGRSRQRSGSFRCRRFARDAHGAGPGDWRSIARCLYTLAIPISATGIGCSPRISASGGRAPEASIPWICGLRGRWW